MQMPSFMINLVFFCLVVTPVKCTVYNKPIVSRTQGFLPDEDSDGNVDGGGTHEVVGDEPLRRSDEKCDDGCGCGGTLFIISGRFIKDCTRSDETCGYSAL